MFCKGTALKSGQPPAAITTTGWPPPTWLPVGLADRAVAWADMGTAPLREPFFADSVQRRRHAQDGRAAAHRMTLDEFLAGAAHAESLTPDGFIFHMSRCGSTLVAQMLAAVSRHIVISEAPPLDAIVQLHRSIPALPGDRHVALLRAMVAALGRRRNGDEKHFVIKLDCWHSLALPLFQRAFPSVPWVFVYRDPVDVLVSHLRQPGTQMVSAIVPAALYGLDDADARPGADYYARVLNRICAAALAHHGDGGLIVNYRDLPGAVASRILPHFGMTCSPGELALMTEAAHYNAKSPSVAFAGDHAAKQREATPQLRALAETHLGDTCRQLDRLAGHMSDHLSDHLA